MNRTILFVILYFLCTTTFAQIARFDWVRQIGGSNTETTGAIANDSAGNVIVSGTFSGELILGTDTLNNPTGTSIFLAKYDSLGTEKWAKILPGNVSVNTVFSRMRISASGKIYLVGSLNGVEYLAVTRKDGSLVGWANQAPNSNIDIDVDSVDNSYMIGTTGSPAKYFIIKFDSSGNNQWSFINGTSFTPYNIKYLNGTVLVTGIFGSATTFTDTMGTTPITIGVTGPLNKDFCLVKYTKNGKLLSANNVVGPAITPFSTVISSDFGPSGKWREITSTNGTVTSKTFTTNPFTMIDSIALASTQCSQVLGTQFRTSTFNESSLLGFTNFLCNNGTANLIDSNGTITSTIGLPYSVLQQTQISTHDFSLDRTDHLYATSSFQGQFTYGDSTGNHLIVSNASSQDVYIARYHNCAMYALQVIKVGDTLSSSITGLLTYQWYNNNAPISGASNSLYAPTKTGNYKVIIHDSWQCVFTSNVLFDSIVVTPPPPTGISSITGAHIKVIPNPATNNILISGLQSGSSFQIIDLSGKVLLNTKTTSAETLIDVSTFSHGIYFIRTELEVIKFVR